MLITIRGSLTYIDTKLNIPNSTSSISRSKIKWDWLWTDSVEPNTCINQLLKLLVFLYLLCHYMLNTFYGLGGHSPWGDHSVQFSHSVVSDSLQPHGLQHSRPCCPSQTPRACSNSCPSSQWCHTAIVILCCPLLLPPSIFPSIRVFSSELVLCIRWPKYWSLSFNISPSNEYSRLIFFRVDWLDLLAVQRTLMSLLQHHSSNASILQHCFLYSPTLTSIHDYWKSHSFD